MKIYSTRKLYAAGILPKPSSTEDVVQLAERLRALRLGFAADHLTELVTQSVKAAWSSTRFLDELIRLELERQEERRIKQALRISHIPSGPTISNFDFAYQPSVSRNQIETLSTCQWIHDCQCVLLQGPPGVGKTHLAIALATRALENGFSVSYLLRAELWSYNPPFLNRIVIVVRSVFYSVNSASLRPASAARPSPPNIVPRHYPALF
jgi:SpoVK/Ycf46/Vps4 family AAA+-type ATPase